MSRTLVSRSVAKTTHLVNHWHWQMDAQADGCSQTHARARMGCYVPPFDCHDWIVRRPSTREEVRYVTELWRAATSGWIARFLARRASCLGLLLQPQYARSCGHPVEVRKAGHRSTSYSIWLRIRDGHRCGSLVRGRPVTTEIDSYPQISIFFTCASMGSSSTV
jgi:hypothetical protein